MSVSLSVVLPLYNEEASVETVVRSTLKALGAATDTFELLIVDDGSTDQTAPIAARLERQHPDKIRLLRHPRNLGFGQALKTGFEVARFDYLFFNSADNFLLPEELFRTISLLDRYDIVLQYRESRVDYSAVRKFASRCYHLMIGFLFGVRLPDIGWLAVYPREVYQSLSICSRGDFILAEVLIKARRMGCKMGGLTVHYEPRRDGVSTGARPSTIAKILWEMLKYGWRS